MDIKLQPNITGTNVNLVKGATQADLTNAVNNAKTYRDEAQAFSILSEDKSIESAYSALNASVSATTAIDKANIATNKATEANNSAINASASEAVCIAKATIATDKADIATAQSVIATDKANEASVSANTATTQAGIATTKASEASTSASNALTSENNADTSEANALIYRNQAELFANSINPSDLVHISGAETITGNKTFSGTVSGLTKATVGLSNVDNTSDANKPISTATQTALNTKVDKVVSTDNAVVRFDGTTGEMQNSPITIDDKGNIGSGTQSFNGLGGSGFKNYIINGNFDVWQYAKSQTTSGYGSDDRWLNGCAQASQVVSRQLCTDTERALFNANYFSRTVVTRNSSTLDIVYKNQQIEDVTKLANKKVTLSFWAKADSNKNISIQFVQNFGTGGTPSNIVDCGNTIVALTTTWQKKVVTINLPSIVGKTLGTDGSHTSFTRLMIWYDAGSNFNSGLPLWQSGTFDIAQVQLEEGSIATPFENRPYGLELSLCQRYYEKIDTNRCNTIVYGTGTGFEGAVKFKTVKRSTPSIALGTASHWRTLTIYHGVALSAIGAQEITESGFQIIGTSTGGNITAGYAGRVQVGDGYTDNGLDGIFVSAEL